MCKAYTLFCCLQTPRLGRTLAYANAMLHTYTLHKHPTTLAYANAIQTAYIKYAHAIYKKACTNKRVVI